MKTSLFLILGLFFAGAAARASSDQSEPRHLTYDEVLHRWDRSCAYGDPRDLKTFSRDMITRRESGLETDDFSEGLRDGAWIRFYARSEDIFGGATPLVMIAALIGVLFAAHRFVLVPLRQVAPAAASRASRVPEVSSVPDSSKLHGVRGWLLFLCIWTTVLWPLFTFSTLYRMSEEWAYLSMGLMIFAIASGITLWCRRPVGLVLVRTFLISIVVLNLISILLWGAAHPDRVPLTIFQAGIPTAWLIYLYQSKRVRATFASTTQPPGGTT